MKGPGYRYDLDPRRQWHCQSCGREVRVPGDVSAVRCGCKSDAGWMLLTAETSAKTQSAAEVVARFFTPRPPREPEPELPPRQSVAKPKGESRGLLHGAVTPAEFVESSSDHDAADEPTPSASDTTDPVSFVPVNEEDSLPESPVDSDDFGDGLE